MAERPKMSRQLRAKQFMPFSALKGFEEALREVEKPNMKKKIMSDDAKDCINSVLTSLHSADRVQIVYFCGGEYLCIEGCVYKIDKENGYIRIVDKDIRFDDIYSITAL